MWECNCSGTSCTYNFCETYGPDVYWRAVDCNINDPDSADLSSIESPQDSNSNIHECCLPECTPEPTRRPTTKTPTRPPTTKPPTKDPTSRSPTESPTDIPSRSPSISPTLEPTDMPSVSPTVCADLEGMQSNDGTDFVSNTSSNHFIQPLIGNGNISDAETYTNPGFKSSVNCSRATSICFIKCDEDIGFTDSCGEILVDLSGVIDNSTDLFAECSGMYF